MHQTDKMSEYKSFSFVYYHLEMDDVMITNDILKDIFSIDLVSSYPNLTPPYFIYFTLLVESSNRTTTEIIFLSSEMNKNISTIGS